LALKPSYESYAPLCLLIVIIAFALFIVGNNPVAVDTIL
jgi:hypothetical protein